MGRLMTIGELLIDFIPKEKGRELKDVLTFERAPGGAPANVAAAVARLGGESYFLGKIGQDAFGDFLEETLIESGVSVDYLYRTTQALTALAFVSLKADGERDFSFYRKPSADLLLEPSEVPDDFFCSKDYLHFCSVDLVDAPVKQAHIKAIEAICTAGGIVSFDPNLRVSLWESEADLIHTVWEFIPKAHIIKVSDEELVLLTGNEVMETGARALMIGSVSIVIVTKGAGGATVYTQYGAHHVPGYVVDVVDTTGAGDAFIGTVLYQLMALEWHIGTVVDWFKVLDFANRAGALVASKPGVIHQLPSFLELEMFVEDKIKSLC